MWRSARASGAVTFPAAPPAITPMLQVVSPKKSSRGQAAACTSARTASSASIAERPTGAAECPPVPSVRSVSRSEPFEPTASLFSVGSPAINQRHSRASGWRFATRAPMLPCSSSTTNNRPSSSTPSARSRSAAASCVARIPLASHAPRPYRYSSSSNEAKCGGTVSMCVENTSRGGAPVTARRPGRCGGASSSSTR